MTPVLRDAGLRLIIGYKLVKAGLELLGGPLLFTLSALGTVDRFRAYIVTVRQHAVEAWVLELSRLIETETTTRHVQVLAAVLVLDGVLSAVEGWSLHRRYTWGSWLVIFATSTLLPFEALELLRRASLARALLLVINLAIVAYLVRRRRRELAT